MTQADIRARQEEEDVRAYREELDEERKTVTLRQPKAAVPLTLKERNLTVIQETKETISRQVDVIS